MSTVASSSGFGPSVDADEAMERFSTLFAPATPRASPTMEGMTASQPKPIPQPKHVSRASGSDFGSFVSVPAAEDPLSTLGSLDNAEALPQPLEPSPPDPPPPKPLRMNRHFPGQSLEFFDKFVSDARAASQSRHTQVLDELLLHDADPLFWPSGRDENEPVVDPESKPVDSQPDDSLSQVVDNMSASPSTTAESSLASSIIDADPDDVRTPRHTGHPRRHKTRPSPVRSGTYNSPPKPAPPIASKPSVSSIDETHVAPSTGLSSSYQALSDLSSRLISSLPPDSESSHPRSQSLSREDRRAPYMPLPAPSTLTYISATLTSSHPSPFSPVTFVPPSGAPGFTGRVYDWDKGFSQALEKELVHSRAASAPSQASASTRSPTPPGSAPSSVAVSQLIEKKSGSVGFVGRREATLPVLTTDLADLIRSHLPALARLPKHWTLQYSLDQDGISLKTLYRRCGTPKPGSCGSLVVVKDAEDSIFGAWIAEGVHINSGHGYYGSGEAFLWKYVDGQCKVFKWTGKNDYVSLCEDEYMSFGGGDGSYGLYLDETLFDGSSARCPTFDNEPLCSPGPQKGGATPFECVGLEVWAIGP